MNLPEGGRNTQCAGQERCLGLALGRGGFWRWLWK
jgi:hypothetical protein